MYELKRLLSWKKQLAKVDLTDQGLGNDYFSRVKYPVCLTDFMQEVHRFSNQYSEWDLVDPATVLKENGITDVLKVDLDSKPLPVLLAILVENVQQDRFCKGILLQMLANGYLLQLLTQIEKCYRISPPKYKFCAVSFNDSCQTYSYLCEDETIQVGDRVIVPVGAQNIAVEATVKKIIYAPKEEAPYPFEQLKKIIKRVKNKFVLTENECRLSHFPFRKIDKLQTLIGDFGLEADTKKVSFVCPTLKLENIAGNMFHGHFEVKAVVNDSALNWRKTKLCLQLQPQVEELVAIIKNFGGTGSEWEELKLIFDDRNCYFDYCYDKAEKPSTLKIWVKGFTQIIHTWKVDYLVTRNGVSLLIGDKEI